MVTITQLIHIIIDAIAIFIEASFILSILRTQDSDSKEDAFMPFIVNGLVSTVCDIIFHYANGNPELVGVSMVSMVLGSMALCYSVGSLGKFFAFVTGDHDMVESFSKIIDDLILFYWAIIGFLASTGKMMTFTEYGFYRRGEYWYIQYVLLIGLLVSYIFVTMMQESLEKSIRIQIVFDCLIPIIIVPLGFKIINEDFSTLATLLLILVIYSDIYVSMSKNLVQTEKDLNDARYQTMVAQIQPHFMYNTLASISEMCHGKAPDAEKLTNNFSSYLRGNLATIQATGPIPFRNELQHVKTYLEIEKARFGDKLNIEFDIKETYFAIPALALQTMVENAIRRGVTKKIEGGTVKISTKNTGDEILVIVEDDGVGFDVNAPLPNDRPHVGITNTRYRIETMLGGKLDITSSIGVGTKVIISIPCNKEG